MAWSAIDPLPNLKDSQVGIIVCRNEVLLSNWVLKKLANYRITVLASLENIPADISALIRVMVPSEAPNPGPLPVLDLLPSLSNFYEEADSNSHAVRYLQSPPASIFTLSYEWSSRLQSGLEWLAERVVPQPAPPLIVKYEAKLTPQPLPASLADIFQSHVNCLFLSPLIVLIREWAAQNFYEPVGHIDFARCRK